MTGKERKESGEFIGAEGVREHLKNGPPRRRVGFIIEGAPARRKWIYDVFCSVKLTLIPLFWQRELRFSQVPNRLEPSHQEFLRQH